MLGMMSAQTQAHPAPYHAYRAPLPHLPFEASSYQQHHNHHLLPTSFNLANSIPSTASPIYAYMNPTSPQPAPYYSFQSSPRHGIKRGASDPEDEFERSNHISTQFKKLRLNNGQDTQFFTEAPVTQHNAHTSHVQHPSYQGVSGFPAQHQPSPTASHPKPVPTLPSDEFMTVDETPHKIFIPDLDSEIASIEAAEQSSAQLFLPDFEKQIGAIPDHVLRSNRVSRLEHGESSKVNDQALVLYRDPVSISVPEEEDAVRKAILEARRGIRERMRKSQQRERENASVELINHGNHGGASSFTRDYTGLTTRQQDIIEDFPRMEDGDAMDFD